MRFLSLPRGLAVAGVLLASVMMSACQDAVVDAPLADTPPFTSAQASTTECHTLGLSGPSTIQAGSNAKYTITVTSVMRPEAAQERGANPCDIINAPRLDIVNPPGNVTVSGNRVYVGACVLPGTVFGVRVVMRYWHPDGYPYTETSDTIWVTVTSPPYPSC